MKSGPNSKTGEPLRKNPLTALYSKEEDTLQCGRPNIPLFQRRLFPSIPGVVIEEVHLNPLTFTLSHYPIRVHMDCCTHHIYSLLLSPSTPFSFYFYFHFLMYMHRT